MCICDPLSSQGLHQRQLFHNGGGWCVIVEAHYLQQSSSVSSQKNSINNFFLTLGLPFLTPPPPSPKVDTVLVLSQTSDNHYIQICQLEKDKQKRVFCGVFRCCFFAYNLDSEAGKAHNMDHSRPFVCGFGWGEGFSVI